MSEIIRFDLNRDTVSHGDLPAGILMIFIDHIDVNSENNSCITLNYADGFDTTLRFAGNGGLTFMKDGESVQVGKGVWHLKEKLGLSKDVTAFCSNTYIKNTWRFCTRDVTSVTFSDNSSWTGLNSVAIQSLSSIPLYMTDAEVTTVEEAPDKILLCSSSVEHANYAKRRVVNYRDISAMNGNSRSFECYKYHRSEFYVLSTSLSTNDVNSIFFQICGCDNFFKDIDGFVYCTSKHDIMLLNKTLGTSFLI